MNSKEALDKLYMACDSELLYEQSGIISANELTTIIEQDLERLEKLEQAKKLIFVLLEQVPLKKLHNRGLHITTKDGKSIPFLEYINKNLEEIWEIKIELYD